MSKEKIRLVILLIIAQFSDLFITIFAIQNLDCWEANPVMSSFSTLQIALFKISCIAGLVFLGVKFHEVIPRTVYKLLVAFSFLPVVWNIFVIFTETGIIIF